MYPGQSYWHEHNANIRRAEENWMQDHGFAKGIPVVHETDLHMDILEMPPLPSEAWQFIEDTQRAAEEIIYGKDAGTNTQRES